ncbi:MAG: hypothetical protein ABI678_26575 [Kofleriaceae bacterium]
MSGPKRNPDSLNTIGVVVVGICGAVMVYVSITALQAFYMNDTSELQTMQDYGGQDTVSKSHKADEMRNITEPQIGTPSITIDRAMDLVVRDATKYPDRLVPGVQPEGFVPKRTEKPHPGRPEMDLPAVPPPGGATAGSGAGSGTGSGSGSGSTAAAGSGATAGSGAGSADNGANIHLHSVGSPADRGPQPVGGAGGAPVGHTGGSATIAPGGHAQ